MQLIMERIAQLTNGQALSRPPGKAASRLEI
jgi:hypothetical protein